MVDEEKYPDEEQELYENYRFTVDKGQSPIRIDKFLTAKIENASRTKVQLAAEAGCIIVNNQPVKSNYKVKGLDVISVLFEQPPREIEILPENITLDILYEDDDLLLVNKSAGMVVHPSYGHYTGTLVNALAWHLKDSPLFQGKDVRPGLVHRIDKNTSGILLIAKNELSKSKLALQFFHHTIHRRYIALIWGEFKEDTGVITGNIGRCIHNRKIMQVFQDEESGKSAITHYRVLARFGYVSLIECRLETGRTHQIRVHMSYSGHPVFNDPEYGGDRILRGTTFTKYKQFIQNCFKTIPRQALHAKSLGFVHPTSGKELYFETDLPEDFNLVVEKWKSYTQFHNLDIDDIT